MTTNIRKLVATGIAKKLVGEEIEKDFVEEVLIDGTIKKHSKTFEKSDLLPKYVKKKFKFDKQCPKCGIGIPPRWSGKCSACKFDDKLKRIKNAREEQAQRRKARQNGV